MQNNKYAKKITIRLFIVLLIGVSTLTLIKFNYFLYDNTIATVVSAKDTFTGEKTGTDGKREYTERYYNQSINAQIQNGENKGKTVLLSNSYTSSGVYDTKYSKGDDLFIEQIEEDENGNLSGVITSQKRDFYVAFGIVLLLSLIVIIGGLKGALTIVSLVLNLGVFYFVILLYFRGINILALTVPMVLVFAALLLVFMYGTNIKTLLAFTATAITSAITLVIAFISLKFSGNIDYDFLEYIIQPYDPVDARNIFLAEILIGCMGAVMDVVVTMIVTVDEITLKGENLTTKDIFKSCRSMGDEIVGTMISIMFFTNLAGSIPFFVLSMRNGIAIHTVIRYNCFFEIARFLSGSIAVVLAIPVAAAIAIIYYKRRLVKC